MGLLASSLLSISLSPFSIDNFFLLDYFFLWANFFWRIIFLLSDFFPGREKNWCEFFFFGVKKIMDLFYISDL